MKNTHNSKTGTILQLIARSWTLFSLGFFFGVGSALCFFRIEIERSMPEYRMIYLLLALAIALLTAFMPPLILEIISGIRAWQHAQRSRIQISPNTKEAEQDASSNR
jgi:hypothetical protein